MAVEPVTPEIAAYLDAQVPARHPELVAMEAEAARTAFPIVGPAAGQFCYVIARMVGARQVFEMGSGFGYSTAWFARAVVENGGGTVHHVVWDQSLSDQARKHLAVLGLDHVVEFHVAEAVETLRQTAGPFDLIFNDIQKADYPASLPVIVSKLAPRGVMLVDNMLWHGRVVDPSDTRADTVGVHELTRLVRDDPRWIGTIVPIRDGVLLAQRV